MLSYTGRRNLFGNLVNNSSSATLTLADTLINMCEKRLLAVKDWPFLWRRYTISSVASTVTVTIASPAVFTLTAHGFNVGTPVYFTTTGALPTGLSAGVTYYVIAAGLTASAFEVSTQIGGTAVNTSGTQSGTHKVFTQRYAFPAYIQKPQSIYITVGSYRYTPAEVSTVEEWDDINEVQITSDIPTRWFAYDDGIEIFPRQASSNVITFNARRRLKDLAVADYITGTVDIVTNGSTLVTGSGTTWTAPMVGRSIRITESNVAASAGDGFWYEIDAVPSATTLILKRPYGGTSLTTGAGASYTIAEMSVIPEPHDMTPVYEALQIYWTSVDPNKDKAALYSNLVKDATAQLFRDYGSKANVVLDSGAEDDVTNPNFFISY